MPARRLDEYFRRLGREARRGDVDLEALIRELVTLAVEEALRQTTSSTRREENQCPGIEDLRREIASLKTGIEKLVEKIDELEKKIANITAPQQKKEPEWIRKIKALAERMNGVVPASISGVKIDESKAGILEEYGLLFIRGMRDAYILTVDSAVEFLEMLEATRTPDEEEAATRMGKFSEVFRDLRRAGVIIYSSKHRKWVPQDELKTYREKYLRSTAP